MTGSQVKKLRKYSLDFISNRYYQELQMKFRDAGFKDIGIQLGEIKSDDQDPLIIEIHYPAVISDIEYLRPKILIDRRTTGKTTKNRKAEAVLHSLYRPA